MRANRMLLTLSVALPLVALAGPLDSGPQIGDQLPGFQPKCLNGASVGEPTNPIVAAPNVPGVMIWVGDDSEKNAAAIISFVDSEIHAAGPAKLKGILIFTNPNGLTDKQAERALLKVARMAKEKNVTISYVPGPGDQKSAALYGIDPSARNTILFYRDGKLASKLIDYTWSIKTAKEFADQMTAILR